jgi:hypothetical protein
MLKRFDVKIVSNPVCREPIYNIVLEDFRYYDKDGFELNRAEQEYYRMMHYPVDNGILNHHCWQETWFELEDKNCGLIVDHSMILTRCAYSENALYQLKKISKDIPEAQWLIDTPQKWGYDFALDAVSPDGKIYEVIHVEYDSKDFDSFCNHMVLFDYTVRHTDWKDAAKQIWSHREEWQSLKSFAQNDWKANFLLGWKKSEYTEKSLT